MSSYRRICDREKSPLCNIYIYREREVHLAHATDKDSFDQPILANLHYERSNHRVGDRNFLDVLVALPFSPGEYCAELAILATIFTGARGLPLWLKDVPVFNAIPLLLACRRRKPQLQDES